MLTQIYSLWSQFISIFPESIRWLIALIVFIFLLKLVIDLVKKNFIWLLLLIVFVPASLPLLKEIFNWLFNLLKFIFPSVFLSL